MTNAKSGIEVQVGFSSGQKKIGQLLHAMHLDALGKWMAGNSTAVITVDGVEHIEPLYEAHFIEAAAGPHDFSISVRGPLPQNSTMAKLVTGTTTTVVVEPGMVAVVAYTPKDMGGCTLEVLPSRPA